jgi:tungstate transport system substrate-binding protein
MKKHHSRRCLMGIVAAIILVMTTSPVFPGALNQKNLILVTTTDIQDSGLLNLLIPLFEKQTGYAVKTEGVGSDQAISMGQKGEADVLLVNSPEADLKFMAEGSGVNRRAVMHSDFILVGPADDPVTVKMSKSAAVGFKKIALGSALFFSRGDDSETYAREKLLWKAAGVNPEGRSWYRSTGLGMRHTLNMADENRAYTLTDRKTYLAVRKNLTLDIVLQNDPQLLNVYHVMEVNSAKCPNVNAPGAKAFADFLVSEEIQKIIGAFGMDQSGAPLFFPDAEIKSKNLGK